MMIRPLAKHVEKQLRIGRINTLACARELTWVRTRLHLPRNETFALHSSVDPDVRVNWVDPEEPYDRPLPHLQGERQIPPEFLKDQRGTCPATFVAELNRGRFWGYYGGSVFTADGRLIPELSKDVWGPHLHSVYVRMRLAPPRFLPGRTLSLVTPEAANNYHHWTIDFLSRAGLLQRGGYRLSDFDHVLVKDRALPYQTEAYRRLGIDKSKLLRVHDDLHIVAEKLVVPAVRLDNTRINRSDLQFVRNLYLPEPPLPSAARRRIYVSRRDASFRRVFNEPEIKPLLDEFGFEEVVMSKMSVAEQAKLFAESAVLIGPNGSAFANLVFANPACQVIEFFAPGWVVGYNWMICAGLGLDYTALIGEGPRLPPGSLPRELRQDIHLDIGQLRRILEALPSRF